LVVLGTLTFCASFPARAQAATAAAQSEVSPAPSKDPSKEMLAAARQLFKQGLAHEKNDAWQEALASFEKVARVKMTPQVRYHVALCHENLGRLVDALNGFELAVQEAKAAGAKSVYDQAPLRAAALRERVAYLRITVTGTIRTSRIFIDDRVIDVALLGAQIPVDPGKHLLVVKRGEEVIEQIELDLSEKQREVIELTIDDPEPPPEPKKSPLPLPPPRPRIDQGNPRAPAYITAGAGIVVLAGAGVFFGLRQATLYNLDCDTIDPHPLGPTASGCHPDSQPTADLAQTYTHVTNVLAAVGGAAVATGVVLFFVLAPEDEANRETARRVIRLAATPGGVMLSGRF
jgi:hypothetical protein